MRRSAVIAASTGHLSTRVLLVLCLAGPSAHAFQPGVGCIPYSTGQSIFATADFDGDQILDVARIAIPSGPLAVSGVDLFRLCPGSPVFSAIPVAGWSVSTRDIDHDNDLDLLLTDRWSRRTAIAWLNDGHGNFSRTDPSGFTSSPDPPPDFDRPNRPGESMAAWPPRRDIPVKGPESNGANASRPVRLQRWPDPPKSLVAVWHALRIRPPPSYSF